MNGVPGLIATTIQPGLRTITVLKSLTYLKF